MLKNYLAEYLVPLKAEFHDPLKGYDYVISLQSKTENPMFAYESAKNVLKNDDNVKNVIDVGYPLRYPKEAFLYLHQQKKMSCRQ